MINYEFYIFDNEIVIKENDWSKNKSCFVVVFSLVRFLLSDKKHKNF